jgi:hypothetical protein
LKFEIQKSFEIWLQKKYWQLLNEIYLNEFDM